MNTLEASFSAWLAFLSALSVDMDVVLNPPATDAQIQQLEDAIGFELPPELVVLYKITNGQQDPYHVEPRTGQYSVSLFGYYDFLSTTDALAAYRFNKEIRDDYGSEIDSEITVLNSDPVNAANWQEGWLPIAGSGANQIAMDFTPLQGGTYGQLIHIGADEFERFVQAETLSEFFERATNETGTDKCAIEYGVPDTSDAHVPEEYRVKLNPFILYITAEWNHPFYRDNCAPEPVYEQPQHINDSNEVNDRFRNWLLVQGVEQNRIDQISMMSSIQLSMLLDQQPDLPEWFKPGGIIPPEIIDSEIFPKEQFPDGVIPPDFQLPDNLGNSYVTELGFQIACDKAVENTGEEVLSLEEYQLFHRYLVMEGIWTEEDYLIAEQTMVDLPEVIAHGKASDSSYFCSSI